MQTDTKYYASCSFGKDSIATILLALEHGEPLDGAIYVEVMFDNSRNISGDNPEAIGWIDEVAIPKLAELGCPTIKLRSEVDYVGYFHKRCTKGKREGKCHGFIYSIGCPLLRDCKLRPMRQFLKGKSVVQYVGIAIDEPQRLEALHKQKGRISLLEKYGYTEKMAMEKCREYGLVSPLYETSNRGGCWFCPKQPIKQLALCRQNHLDLWQELIALDNSVPYEDRVSPSFKFNDTLAETIAKMDRWIEKQSIPTLI